MSDVVIVTAGPIYETVVSSTECKDKVLNSPENKAEKATHSSNGQDLAITSLHYQNKNWPRFSKGISLHYQNISPQYGRRIYTS